MAARTRHGRSGPGRSRQKRSARNFRLPITSKRKLAPAPGSARVWRVNPGSRPLQRLKTSMSGVAGDQGLRVRYEASGLPEVPTEGDHSELGGPGQGTGIAGFSIRPGYDPERPLYAPSGGYVVKDDVANPYRDKPKDVWLVQQSLFESTYGLLRERDASGYLILPPRNDGDRGTARLRGRFERVRADLVFLARPGLRRHRLRALPRSSLGNCVSPD